MRVLKIGIAILVVSAIAFFVIRSLVLVDRKENIPLPKNQFTERIEKEIDSLSNFPNSKFCRDVYDYVQYLIDDYYKPNPPHHPYGRLGNSQSENDQWKENFTKNLYSIYTDKFIKQAFYVFNGSEWNAEDLRFIRCEYQILRRSKLLEKGSPVDKIFDEIQAIFLKYDEISSFISTCNGFSYSDYSLSDRFPILDVKEKISRAATYRNNLLENQYVSHCSRLNDRLKEIPQVLFRAHVRYLDNKISQWSDLYSNYSSQSDYANNLYKPIKSEIDALDNDVYKVANFDKEYQKLSDNWSADNIKAYNYSYPKIN